MVARSYSVVAVGSFRAVRLQNEIAREKTSSQNVKAPSLAAKNISLLKQKHSPPKISTNKKHHYELQGRPRSIHVLSKDNWSKFSECCANSQDDCI